MKSIPFNHAYLTGKELENIHSLLSYGGDGAFTRKCHQWLESNTGVYKTLLTHSCTGALEMSALLTEIQPGDEIIMPSYTFSSTANSFVLRGATPVFVDIRADNGNLDESLIEAAITPKTKAIVPVHYAGVACEMDSILSIANKYNLFVIEDAAQCLLSEYKNQPLGTLGNFGAYSFHASKNIFSGEGGALLINDKKFAELAEIVWEKGTDRRRYYRGQVDKYTWQHVGSSYLPGELIAAFLLAQLEGAKQITQQRLKLWETYHTGFLELEKEGYIKRPFIPDYAKHNAHLYYILCNDTQVRDAIMFQLKSQNIQAFSHYVPLHLSPAGKRYARTHGSLCNTEKWSDTVLRMPLFIGLNTDAIERIINIIKLTSNRCSSNKKKIASTVCQ